MNGNDYLINEGSLIGYMPTEFGANQSIVEKKIVADGALYKGRLVEVSTDFKVKHATAGSAKVLGIAAFDTESGQPATIDARDGLVKLIAASAITVGAHVVAAADGKVASGTTNILGLALNTAVTDGFVYVKLGK